MPEIGDRRWEALLGSLSSEDTPYSCVPSRKAKQAMGMEWGHSGSL